MSNIEVVRAWKDVRYRSTLSADELAKLPTHPSGPLSMNSWASDSSDAGPDSIGGACCSVLCMTYDPCAESTITPIPIDTRIN